MKTRNETSAGGIVYRKIPKNKKQDTNNINTLEYRILNTEFCLEWLICQHSHHKGWVFPKGMVGDNHRDESMEEAALRETREEGGVNTKIITPLNKEYKYFFKFGNELIKKTVYYYLMEYISGDPSDHDFEMMDAKFVSEDEVRKLLTYPSEKKAFEDATKLIKKLRLDKFK